VRFGEIARELNVKSGPRVCVRIVMASGVHYQSELNV
jgi:hypothetical protein